MISVRFLCHFIEVNFFFFLTEALKTPEDKTKEEDLLQQLVTVVHERSKLVDKMDDERQR